MAQISESSSPKPPFDVFLQDYFCLLPSGSVPHRADDIGIDHLRLALGVEKWISGASTWTCRTKACTATVHSRLPAGRRQKRLMVTTLVLLVPEPILVGESLLSQRVANLM